MMHLKFGIDFSWNERVSSVLSLIFVILLGVLVAWLSLKAANQIVDGAQESSYYNTQKRLQMKEVNKTKNQTINESTSPNIQFNPAQ